MLKQRRAQRECHMARRSDDGGVTPSEEMVHISPMKVTPKLGKGAQDTWRLRWLRAAGLIKPAYRDDSSSEARLWANQDGGGVHGPAFKPLQTLGRSTEEMPRFQTGPGKSGRPGL